MEKTSQYHYPKRMNKGVKVFWRVSIKEGNVEKWVMLKFSSEKSFNGDIKMCDIELTDIKSYCHEFMFYKNAYNLSQKINKIYKTKTASMEVGYFNYDTGRYIINNNGKTIEVNCPY